MITERLPTKGKEKLKYLEINKATINIKTVHRVEYRLIIYVHTTTIIDDNSNTFRNQKPPKRGSCLSIVKTI